MNKKPLSIFLIAIVIALIAGLLIGKNLYKDRSDHEMHSGDTHSDDMKQEDASVWTCSMHPQIQQAEPGDCPICGMDLIPLTKNAGDDDGPRVMSMSDSSRALAQIETTSVQRDYPEAEIRLVGKLNYDETREKSLSARFPVRIDELFVNFVGIKVNKNEHLAKVYSPELFTAQRELLSAYRADPNSSITKAAKEKLRLWDLLPEQIDAILQSGEAKDHFILKAPIGGIVVAKYVKEGDYVKKGEPLFQIADLSVLWAHLDAYESDLPWLRYGQDVDFTLESFPGENFKGKIIFIKPEVDAQTRTIPIRMNVSNPDMRLKPGMFVRAIVKSRLSASGQVYAPEFTGKWISPMHPEIVKDHPGTCDFCGMDLVPAETLGYVKNEDVLPPIIIPSSAILQTGKRAIVYVKMKDADRPSYQGRVVTLGPRAGDDYIIASGLTLGEEVVTHGAFKIDSALQIQAKPSMMHAETNDMQMPKPRGHNHGLRAESMMSHDHASHSKNPEVKMPNEKEYGTIIAILYPYLELQEALANDDLNASKDALKSMMTITGHSGKLADSVHMMLAAESLEEIRKPHFEILSNKLIHVLKDRPSSIAKTPDNLMIMYCPMVDGNRGARWLQNTTPLRNPYFGSMMLGCGDIVEHLKSDVSDHNRDDDRDDDRDND